MLLSYIYTHDHCPESFKSLFTYHVSVVPHLNSKSIFNQIIEISKARPRGCLIASTDTSEPENLGIVAQFSSKLICRGRRNTEKIDTAQTTFHPSTAKVSVNVSHRLWGTSGYLLGGGFMSVIHWQAYPLSNTNVSTYDKSVGLGYFSVWLQGI